MRRLIAIILGTVVLTACSGAEAPSTSPPSDATPVSLAAVAFRPIEARPPASGCTAEASEPGSLDRAMALATVPIRFQFQSGGPRDNSAGGWSDSVPGPTIRFDSNKEHQTVEVSADSVARLEPASTVTLIDGRLELYRLDADDRAGNEGVAVATVDLGGDADGLDVPLPTKAGRWLLSVYAHWQTDCAAGDGYLDLLLITA